ncbi:MAG: class I SAM-dependent RNA methyltransferase [Gemmatimonadetes bacterium]|nr:class I SAM-dependent RNA methyltransferase [Gemmatimonadota bacterium]
MTRDVELRIDGIAAGGAGVGRDEGGRAVFVHRTATGELVTARVVAEKKRWARASLQHVLEPSPERREAPCRFYARCGGCTLEHLSYEAQLSAKAGIVAAALTRIGGLTVTEPDVVASPRQLRYRNRVSFTLVRLRDGSVRAGFHELQRPDRVIDIDEACLMPEETVAHAWGGIRRAWGRGAARLPSGDRLRLTLRGTAGGRTSLLVQGGYSEGRPGELIERVESLDAIWHQPRADEPPILLAGMPEVTESWHGEDVQLGGALFLQVNREAAALLEDHVVELAGDVEDQIVVDAYCGVGLHARRFARAGARVYGIELDPHAVSEARRAVHSASFTAARVEDALPDMLPASLVILNPPRAGVDERALAALVETRPSRIIYISCDPATLARDLQRLTPAFDVRSVRCFDLFPQTAHVETVVEMTCSTM